jgi:hypothetical protein
MVGCGLWMNTASTTYRHRDILKILSSPINMPGHMLTLADRTIFRPAKEPLWPGRDNLDDHRRRTFKN